MEQIKDRVSLTEVRGLLAARRGDWQKVAAENGVSHSWISKFVRGKIDNPGIATLSTLMKYLKSSAKKAA